MLAFGEHSYLAFLFEIWHRNMVCRLEDIYYNLESPPHTSHDDFDTEGSQLTITVYVFQGRLPVHTPKILLLHLVGQARGSDFAPPTMNRRMPSSLGLVIRSRKT